VPVGRLTKSSDPGYGWVIVTALGVTETVSYGVLVYAFSVLLLPMQDDLHWSRLALTGAFSLAILVSGLAGIRVGRLLDYHNPRPLMTAGSALGALLVLAWSQVGNLMQLYVLFAGLGLVMALVLYEPAFIVVTKWFSIKRKAALTTLTLIAAFASFIFSPLTEALVHAYGWRNAVAVLAAILAAITVPLHALVLRPAPRLVTPSATSLSPAPTRRTVMGTTSFWLIVSAFVLNAFVTVAVAVHLVALLVGDGRSPAFAAFAAGLMGLAQIPGRLVFGPLGRRFGEPATAAIVFGLSAAALAFLALTEAQWAVLLFVLCFGTSNGMVTLLRATLIGDLYGRETYGAISGVVSAFALAARALAPFGAALIALAPGGYTTLLVVLAGCSALAAFSASRGAAVAVGARLEISPAA
jgi:MFS family permease